MNKLDSTLPSSAQVDIELRAVPPEVRAWLYARDAELQRYKATAYARGALVRQIRTTKLEEVVINAIRNCRAAFWVKQPRERASFLARKIALDLNRRGVAQDFDIRIIRRVVREVEKNPDILIQNAPAD